MDLSSSTLLIAFFVWAGFTVVLLRRVDRASAFAASTVAAALFLPTFRLDVIGLPVLNRMTLPGIFLGLASLGAVRSFRFRALGVLDLPFVLWCVSPLLSSLSNGLGWWDGLSGLLARVLSFGTPYVIGRAFFRSNDVGKLLVAVAVGAALYAPLCVYETRFGPSLHEALFGADQIDWQINIRRGGYRPQVFQTSPLLTCFWIAAGLVAALALARRNEKSRRIWIALALGLAVCAWNNHSVSALCLAAIGAVLALKGTRWLPAIVSGGALVCLAARVTSLASGEAVLRYATWAFGSERAWSLRFRFLNDDLIVNHALMRPLFGWGGWNRGAVMTADGNVVSVFDALWSLTLAENGLFGLVSLYLALATPALLACRARGEAAFALAAIGTLVLLESGLNDPLCPVWFVVVGASVALQKNRAEAKAPAPESNRAFPRLALYLRTSRYTSPP